MGSCPFLSDFTHSAHPRWKRRSIATACAAPSLLFFHQLKRESDYADCLAVDQRGLRSMARNMRHAFGKKRDDLQTEHDRLLEKSRAAVLVRRVSLPKPEFADDLPINARRGEIASLIEKHPVVIVCGETGSGKTTQIPKICLEPVSYTHLDVYKRQVHDRADDRSDPVGRVATAAGNGGLPVRRAQANVVDQL